MSNYTPYVFTGLCLMCGLFGALMKPLELTAAIEEDEEGTDNAPSSGKFRRQGFFHY